MSGLTIRAVREAIAEQLAKNLDRETNVYPYMQDAPQYPCVMVLPATGDAVSYFKTFSSVGLAELRLDLHIYTTSADPVSAQIAIDDYLSAGGANQSSVLDAILADMTLGGAVETCVPLTAIYGPLGADPASAVIPLQIILRKDVQV